MESDTTLLIMFSHVFTTQRMQQRHARSDVGVVEVDKGLDVAEVDKGLDAAEVDEADRVLE